MGSSPTFVRACCAIDIAELQNKLKLGASVTIVVVAAGTGIGTVSNPGGSESKNYHLAALTHRETPQKASVYWMMRDHLLTQQNPRISPETPKNVRLAELQRDVTALGVDWHDRSKRAENGLQRNATLACLLKAHAANNRAKSEENKCPESSNSGESNNAKSDDINSALRFQGDPTSTPLAQEALFAAVESDSACAAALSNSRMGALFVSVVQEVAKQTVDHELSVATSGTNIRRTVLQRVVRVFRSLNALEGVSPQEASALLVESLRYALFDGYVGARFSANKLVSGRGVLVDNAVYKKEVPDGYEMLRDAKNNPITKMVKETNDKDAEDVSYTACYPKGVGRFSITPAMVVVLSTLMSNAFEENFSNIGDVFERDMAKFLYFTVQVFHGRTVRELVAFIVGPFAAVGEAAQEILNGDRRVDFGSLTLRIAGSLQKVHDARRDELWSNKSGGAWIEISPPGLPSADVVLHIPDVITLPIQCKDRVNVVFSVATFGSGAAAAQSTSSPNTLSRSSFISA
ncbi:Hypothetical protein, putative [Bodo saltans]|uniref:Uncharacterized protein n=1 Tax=Bodo saltans TaxID=75058 RepID=A0A0S4JL22_BODSA|nr:Hypothetical protein, putative [Bodo saltans]|eukprot:CUG91081.1 Hypothetical protein, putative [Bodo saltans]